ncbi:hypothetical protein PQO03_05840 [Lentisphaera profundi]|uniref:DUF4177 domain-containing protein n=1 Tax=Lentisphaera profundi TaxID=1658616 RepID=A0ABY7VMJ8_9BACT|nr:hypothetical protein [Lentisphaera profundi]WDE95241.1 hypothetical protein PQO03_05840 [Lentisphaera profundi]
MSELRQQLLILYSSNSSPDSSTIGYSMYDGSSDVMSPHEVDTPMPYDTVLDAMRDGWRVIQYPSLGRQKGNELETDYLEFEFVLEKIVEKSHE